MNRSLSRGISLIMVIVLPATTFAADCRQAESEGRAAARSHNSLGWVVAGVGAGFAFGLIGVGAMTGIAAISRRHPRGLPSSPDCDIDCYNRGYGKRAKRRNIIGAVGGGLLGAGFAVLCERWQPH